MDGGLNRVGSKVAGLGDQLAEMVIVASCMGTK